MKHFLFTALLVLVSVVGTIAQDLRERHYYYEILTPSHEPKPPVEGCAGERVTENLNRGLQAALTVDGKGVYLNWRLLQSDTEEITFNVFRSVNGKKKKLNRKPISLTTDFTDNAPSAGIASYWIESVEGK